MTLSTLFNRCYTLYKNWNKPLSVEIETTTICNRRCSYCPNTVIDRPQKFMDERIFYKIIDSLAEMDFCGRISPHFFGEPLMDNRLTTLLQYTRNKLPKIQLKLYTNGDLLSVDKYKELCDAGVDIFRVSQHSANPSNTIVETLNYKKEHKNENWIRPIEYINYYDEYHKSNDIVNSNLFYNRGGIIQNISPTNRIICLYVNQLTFDYEGNAVLCCNDFLSSVKFGNIKDSSVKEIWYNANYVRARRKIMSGNWVFDICKKCNH